MTQPGEYWFRPKQQPPRGFVADPNIGRRPYRTAARFTGRAANVESTHCVQFNRPSAVYQITGASYTSDGSDLGLGSFKVRFASVQGARLTGVTDELVVASSVVGTFPFPVPIGDNGWAVDRNNGINVTVLPLVADLTIEVVMWCIEWIRPRGCGRGGNAHDRRLERRRLMRERWGG